MKLKGIRAIISGASQGLGFAIAKKFILEGAQITICARHSKLLFQAQHELQELIKEPAEVFAKETDIANPQQVTELINFAITKMGGADVLIANAGIYGTKGAIEQIDWDEWSNTINVNLNGTVLQCRSIIPHFKNQGRGKIIILSGGGATKPLPYLSAYAASKAAVVRFAETIAEEVRDFNIDVNTVAPGALNTRLLDEIIQAGPDKVGKTFYEQSVKQKETGGTSLDLGSALCTFLASPLSNGITGKLISAVWDPWEVLPEYISYLKNSDVYTLRRIGPEDRGVTFGESQ